MVPHMIFTKMASTNDLEAFLGLFKCPAAAWEWTEDECTLWLLALSSGKDQQLLPWTQLEYSTTKKVVFQLDTWGALLTLHLLPEVRQPFAYVQQQKDCQWWSMAEERKVEQIISLSTQMEPSAPIRTEAKLGDVCRCSGNGKVKTDNFHGSAFSHGSGQEYTVPCDIEYTREFTSDLGGFLFNQTIVHQCLIQFRALENAQLVRVRCMHMDVYEDPMVSVFIDFWGKSSSEAWCEMCSAFTGEVVLGLSISASHQGDREGGDGSIPPPFSGIPLRDFPMEQSCN